MSDPLDDLKSVHHHERALVPGHWTVQHLERGIAEIERLRAALERAVQHLYNPFEPDNQSGAYMECMAALRPIDQQQGKDNG